MTIQIDPISSPRIITIPETDGNSITIQSLVNQIREWEHDSENLSYTKLLSASGKEVLSATEKVGITAKLENAKLKFEDRASPTDCDVYGGNLVAVDEYGVPINPIEHSLNCTVTVARSSSATMVQDVDIDSIKAKTDNLPSDPASQSLIDVVKGSGWSNETLKIIKELVTNKGRISVR